ncbi:MAG: hypothetical protein AAFZ87_08510 [Planctomycetota bacterium]
MSDQASEHVIVHTAPSFHAAKIVAGLLRSEGIDALVPGDGLVDEFGSAQKLGTGTVVVRRADSERALDIVAAWEAKSGSDEDG